MIHYSKTQLGHDALKQRSLPLNARQRRLLVLIGTEDFESMNEIFKQRLAPPELIEQLSEMGLIMASSVKAMAEPEVQAHPLPPRLCRRCRSGYCHRRGGGAA